MATITAIGRSIEPLIHAVPVQDGVPAKRRVAGRLAAAMGMFPLGLFGQRRRARRTKRAHSRHVSIALCSEHTPTHAYPLAHWPPRTYAALHRPVVSARPLSELNGLLRRIYPRATRDSRRRLALALHACLCHCSPIAVNGCRPCSLASSDASVCADTALLQMRRTGLSDSPPARRYQAFQLAALASPTRRASVGYWEICSACGVVPPPADDDPERVHRDSCTPRWARASDTRSGTFKGNFASGLPRNGQYCSSAVHPPLMVCLTASPLSSRPVLLHA